MRGRIARAVGAGTYQLLGAALLTPAAVALGIVIMAEVTPGRVLALWAACLPASVLLATVPLTRRIEAAALSELLGVEVPERADRLYLLALTSLHLYGGATLSAGVLLLAPGLVKLGDLGLWTANPGAMAPIPLLAAATLAALVAAGFAQRWAARRLLRAEPSRTIEELGRRESLALELHDSVGHALSVVLVQAMAAQASLQRRQTDVATAGRSLEHLMATARDAQQDLDVLLGVLDDGDAGQGPTLDALGTLTRGVDVRASVDRLDRVPGATSRAAYAITREALTNALRHGHGPITLDIAVTDTLVLTVENATSAPTAATAPRSTATPPGIPDMPGIPDAPGIPEVPGTPDALGTPDVAVIPEVAVIPDVSGVSGAPGAPGVVGSPGVSGASGGLRASDPPGAPGVPGSSGRAGRGLTGMRMRARLVGGTCTHQKEVDGTWRIQATLPL
ncbi:histidine kinase [Nonomuraea sp. NPDC003804]|uniref:histidine kinase n=1 Tax=Nonomuraea sp. NPDC003804 TaxID=3154547 RepID=UPI0033B4EB54